MASSEKVIRGVEAGTKAGYLVLIAAGIYLLWSFIGPKGAVKKVTTVPKTIPPAGGGAEAGAPPEATDESQGIMAGGLAQGVTGQIIVPPKDGQVERGAFSSTFSATLELVNLKAVAESVFVEVVCDFYELTGGDRLGIRTTLGTQRLDARQVRRIDIEIETDNVNQLSFEFGQANAIVRLYINGQLAQTTSFYVA
jgi:hypothetical protein